MRHENNRFSIRPFAVYQFLHSYILFCTSLGEGDVVHSSRVEFGKENVERRWEKRFEKPVVRYIIQTFRKK